MRILVLSDSHGNINNMVRAAELTQPELMLHLGDCWPDGEALHRHFPGIPFYQVPGNCDFHSTKRPELLLTLEGKRVLLCHGHTLRVKQSLLLAGFAAEEQQADLFLFGHTHRAMQDQRGKCLFLNPGSIGMNDPPAYGVVEIRNGGITAELKTL